MADIFESLASFADSLDKQGFTRVADSVDKTAKQVYEIKTAQYVGIQGYWVRNSRCWQNCYRQKRVANKDMPAQEIWNECHEEYVKSINNPDSSWAKYADDSTALVKTASKVEKYDNELLSKSEKLVQIAEYLHNKNQPKLAGKAEALSAQIAKEAQFRNMLQRGMDWARGQVPGQDPNQAAIRALQELASYSANLVGTGQNAIRSGNDIMRNKYEQDMAKFQQQAQRRYNQIANVANNVPSLKPAVQSLGQFLQAPRGQRMKLLNKFVNNSNQALGEYATQQSQPQQIQPTPGSEEAAQSLEEMANGRNPQENYQDSEALQGINEQVENQTPPPSPMAPQSAKEIIDEQQNAPVEQNTEVEAPQEDNTPQNPYSNLSQYVEPLIKLKNQRGIEAEQIKAIDALMAATGLANPATDTAINFDINRPKYWADPNVQNYEGESGLRAANVNQRDTSFKFANFKRNLKQKKGF